MTFDLTAGELVRLGRCDGKCLLALEARCDCKCRGSFHGLLADIPLASVAPKGTNVSRSIEGAWTPSVRQHPHVPPGERVAAAVAVLTGAAPHAAGVRQGSTPSRSVRRMSAADVNRVIDLFAEGHSVRHIAREIGVSESAVRKRLKDFEATGTVPGGDS